MLLSVEEDMENWRDSDVNVDSLWIIDKRSSEGKHSNVYHGNFIPQIPNQLIKRYTQKNDVVLDLFMGGGTTLFECEALERNFIGFDINTEIIDFVRCKMDGTTNIKYFINECDVANHEKFDNFISHNLNDLDVDGVDFVIAHPPYFDIVKFTEKKEDLSNISNIDDFIVKFVSAMSNGLEYLKKGKYFAVVAGDIYKNSEVIPLGFYLLDAIKKHCTQTKLKGIIVKNIEGNRGKLGIQNIWKYRALKSDYYLFKHEYIFVFKKM